MSTKRFRPARRVFAVGTIRAGRWRVRVANACAGCLGRAAPAELRDVPDIGRCCPACVPSAAPAAEVS